MEEISLADFAPGDVGDLTRIRRGTFDATGNFVDVPAGGDITLIQFEAGTLVVVPEVSTWRIWLVVGSFGLACGHRRIQHSTRQMSATANRQRGSD